MLIRTIKADWMKLRHSPVWLAFLFLPLQPALMGTFNYRQNIGILQNGWYSLWTQHSLFTCYFFLPSIIGVYCSYLYRLEHMNHNWNAVMTAPVTAGCLYLAKLFTASVMVILTQAWSGILFVLAGRISGLSSPVPSALTEWLLTGALGGVVICGVQLCISLVVRSFAVPVGIAFIGGIVGLGALTKGVGAAVPYALLSLGMRANNPGGPMQCSMQVFLLSGIFYLLACCAFAVIILKFRDIRSE